MFRFRKIIKRILKGIARPNYVLSLALERLLRSMPDEPYLNIQYPLRTGALLHLDAPKTFNEKIQWLKIHDRKPVYTEMTDKYAARDFIARKTGAEYLIPLAGGGVMELF
jgi:hypothetical protein